MKKIQLDVLNLETKQRIRCNFCGDVTECVIGAEPCFLTYYDYKWEYGPCCGRKVVIAEDFNSVEQQAAICKECVKQLATIIKE